MNTLFFRGINLNSLSASRFQFEFTMFFPKSLRTHFFSRNQYKFTSASRIHLDSTFFRKIIMNSLFASRFLLQFTIFFADPLWIRYEITTKTLWNHYEFTICFTILLEIHHRFREFTICLFNHIESIIFVAEPLWIRFEIIIHHLIRDFTRNLSSFSRINYLFGKFTLNPLSFLRNYFEFTILFTLSLWKHYMLHDFTLNSLSVPRINLISTIYFTTYFGNSLWIHYLFCKFPMNSQSAPRVYCAD